MNEIICQEFSENLVEIKNENPVTTSLMIAKHFHKRHDHVMRDIDVLINNIEEVSPKLEIPLSIEKSEYQNDQNGQYYPMYYLDRDAFTLLAMGFTGKKALEWKLKYIEAFNYMEEKLRAGSSIPLPDNRLDIAKLILKAAKHQIPVIKELYPEYFTISPVIGSLEYVSDVNTAYQKWIEEFGITAEWIGEFPTKDIYLSYVRYCTETYSPSMGKKKFYSLLANDFNLAPKQKADGNRYFLTT